MQTKGRRLTLLLVVLTLCIGVFAFTGPEAAQRGRKGTGLIPLTETERATMIYLREEEKLARDVYIKMYESWGATIFSNISVSEQRHMDAVLQLLVKYGIPDPAAGCSVGEFTDADLQKLYDDLIFKGQQSLLDAYIVGRIIEETDIYDLEVAIYETEKVDLDKVYSQLLLGSRNHLGAFNSHIESLTQGDR